MLWQKKLRVLGAAGVFQGVGQTAMDLVLLGAVPTVALAFAAAIVLDAVIELSSTVRRREAAA